MFSNNKKGFTLIELLVVIAIIGILSSVVLASLNTARNKGADANIKSNLGNLRSQAELFYSDQTPTNVYTNVCDSTGGANNISEGFAAAEKTSGTTGKCTDAADAWAAWVPLKKPVVATNNAWCVDSTGFSGEVAVTAAAAVTVCPQ